MTSWPAPTRADHERFCVVEGWRQVRDARGRRGGHHVTYELALPDGRILRTRISHPPDRTGYGAQIWSHILREQLEVSTEEFWTCARGDSPPSRGSPLRRANESLPAELVRLLVHRVGLAESEVATMSREEAVRRLDRYWAEGV